MTKGCAAYLLYSSPSVACAVPVITGRRNCDLQAALNRDLAALCSWVAVAELSLMASVQTLGLWEHWSTFPIVNACHILIDAEETCLLSPVKLRVYSSVWSSAGKVCDEMQTGEKVLLLTFAEASETPVRSGCFRDTHVCKLFMGILEIALLYLWSD